MTITIVPDVDEDGHVGAHTHCYHPTGQLTVWSDGRFYESLQCCYCGYMGGKLHGPFWKHPNDTIYTDIKTTAQRTQTTNTE